jgi:hypothetical protein
MPRPPKWDAKEIIAYLRRLRNACNREGLQASAHLCDILVKAITWERMEQAMKNQGLTEVLKVRPKVEGATEEEVFDDEEEMDAPATENRRRHAEPA